MNRDTLLIRFLYHTVPGRSILKIVVQPRVSKKVGVFLNSRISRWLIPLFVRRNRINLQEYEKKRYESFNDFFIRKRCVEQIDITPGHLISPCDGFLSIYPVDKDSIYRIKHIEYNLIELLKDKELAEHFKGGKCLIFRLTPKHYHRYCYICNGSRKRVRKIEGKLHCVRPVAYTSVPVFLENSREYTEIQADYFERVVQMEIGALLVGKIHNYPGETKIVQGQEKGYFEFGGSTIVVLLEKNRIEIEKIIQDQFRRKQEIEVHMGEKIGSFLEEGGKPGNE